VRRENAATFCGAALLRVFADPKVAM